jgi:diaminopimelate epimerase
MASNYNSRLRAPEILVDGEHFTLIRERETYDDLVRGEIGRFTKMCAGGNDFIVIDNRFGNYPDGTVLAPRLCRRSHSIGADGLLFLERGRDAGRLKMRIFNPDGSEAEMCGNGARCIAAFAYRMGIGAKNADFETLAGPVSAEILGDEVKLKMNEPAGLKLSLEFSVDDRTYSASFINTGVPHTVLVVEDIETADVESLGRKIRNLPMFEPAGTNVDFVELVDAGRIRLRTYERGVEGETLACGTGAAASAIVCSLLGEAASPVSVETRGGSILTVYFKKGEKVTDVYLRGDAAFVCEGAFDLYRYKKV